MTPHPLPPRGRRLAAFVALSLSLVLAAFAQERKSFDLPAGPAEQSLKLFATQSGLDVIFVSSATEGITTPEVRGDLTPQEALDRLLSGTPLVATSNGRSGGIKIRREASVELAEKNVASRPVDDRAADGERGPITMDTFEVFAGRTLNMDIRRSADDAQPYVVFDRRTIEQSGALDLEDFLRQRLTMVTSAEAPSTANNFAAMTVDSATLGPGGLGSSIALRGLAPQETLILVDGHRAAGVSFQAGTAQANINGLPLNAIERVEVLPATAAGIYGGNATAGVINIILRRDYRSTDIKLSYENTFDTDVATRRLDISSGLSLNQGRTRLMLVGSLSDSNALQQQDRSYINANVRYQAAVNPNFLATAAYTGATANIAAVSTFGQVQPTILLTLKGSNTPLNSAFTFVPYGYQGTATDGGAALMANAGRTNLDEADTANQRRRLLRFVPKSAYLDGSVRHQFNSNVELFAEGTYTKTQAVGGAGAAPLATIILPPTAAANPFNERIRVLLPITKYGFENQRGSAEQISRRLLAGITAALPRGWTAGADFTVDLTTYRYTQRVSGTLNSTALTAAVASGQLNVFRDATTNPIDYSPYVIPSSSQSEPSKGSLYDMVIRAGGPIVSIKDVPITLSTAVERRRYEMGAFTVTENGTSSVFFAPMTQVADSIYTELVAPIFTSGRHRRFLQLLELQLSGRLERYETDAALGRGTPLPITAPIPRAKHKMESANPTIAMRWKPTEMLQLRASFGTGFLPPNGNQLVPTAPAPIPAFVIQDPLRGNEFSTGASGTTFVQSGNPNLQPERSKSWSAGIVATPLPQLRLSLDWSRIEKTDAIAFLNPSRADIAALEPYIPGYITRGPRLPNDIYPVGPIIGVDLTARNLSHADTEAVDGSISWKQDFGPRRVVEVAVAATRLLEVRRQFTTASPVFDYLDLGGNLKWRANGTVAFAWGRWSGTWAATYFHSRWINQLQAVDTSVQAARYPHVLLHDVSFGYSFDSGGRSLLGRLMSDTQITAGAKNIFGAEPSLLEAGSPFIDPRVSSYNISFSKSF